MATDASATILLSHAEFATRLAGRLLGDASLGDDALSDAWFARQPGGAHDHTENLATATPGWWAGVVKNVIRTKRRTDRRRIRREDLAVEAACSPSSFDVAARTQTLRFLADALDTLPPIRRQIVVSRYFDQLNSHEIATQLHIAEGTVRWHLHRAIDDLRHELKRRTSTDDAQLRQTLAVLLPGIVFPVDAAAGSSNRPSSTQLSLRNNTTAQPTKGPITMLKSLAVISLIAGASTTAILASRTQSDADRSSEPRTALAASPYQRANDPSVLRTLAGGPTLAGADNIRGVILDSNQPNVPSLGAAAWLIGSCGLSSVQDGRVDLVISQDDGNRLVATEEADNLMRGDFTPDMIACIQASVATLTPHDLPDGLTEKLPFTVSLIGSKKKRVSSIIRGPP